MPKNPADFTEEARIKSTQAFLKGEELDSKDSSSKDDRWYYGVLLRACARMVAGAQLSDLEIKLLKSFRRCFTNTELEAYGNAFKSADPAVLADLFPDTIAKTQLSEPYTQADFDAYLKTVIVPVHKARDNFVLVKPGDTSVPMDGNDPTGEKFENAVDEHGRAVVVYGSGSDGAENSGTIGPARQAPAWRHVTVMLDQWKCISSSSDGIGHNEIYWGIAMSNESYPSSSYQSPTWNYISSGDVKKFPAGTKLWSGWVYDRLTMEVQCWERDNHGDGMWDKFNNFLKDVEEACLDGIKNLSDGNDADLGAGVLAIATVTSMLVRGIIGRWMADDKLVQCNYGFSLHKIKEMCADRQLQYFTMKGKRRSCGKWRLYLDVKETY